jgi:ADP-ribose pyrophosphatase YjhB (NUDIX family)
MFKVFYNNKILLVSESAINDNSFTKINFLSETEIKNQLNIFLSNKDLNNLNIYGKLYVEIPEFLTEYFRIIKASGGVVFNEVGDVLYIKRLGYYDFPKGKLEKNESPESGALREVCEECGIIAEDLKIVNQITRVYHIYSLKDCYVLKETTWFKMEFFGNYELVPQTEEDITEVGWMKKDNIMLFKSGTYPSLLELVDTAISQL